MSPRPKGLTQAERHKLNSMNPSKWNLIQATLIGVDHAVGEYERKWGVGRLICLVSDDTRIRFQRGNAMWATAIADNDPEKVADIAAKLLKAWAIMDAQATEAGHHPLSPVVFETRLEDGTVLAVVRTAAEASQVAAEGRAVNVWTMEELGRVLPSLSLLGQIKASFAGATVDRVIQRTDGFGHAWATESISMELFEEEAA